MTTKPHLLLIDGSNIAHANHNAPTLSIGGFQVQAIYGFLRSLRALIDMTPGKFQLLVLWDGRAQWRFDLYPEYKGNRKPKTAEDVIKRKALDAQLPFIETMLKYLGVPQMRCPTLEADDLAAWMVKTSPGRPITLVSGDKDWLGLVNEWTEWFDPVHNRRVRHDNFVDKTGFLSAQAYYEGKALQGDTSDNLPGIDDMGEKTAQLFLAKWGSFERFFAAVDAGEATPTTRKSKAAKSLHPEQLLNAPEGRERVRLNLKLMNLLEPRTPTGSVLTKEPPAIDKFDAICKRLAFSSILHDAGFYRAFGVARQPAAAAA